MTYEFASADELLRYTADVSAGLRTILAAQTLKRQAELRDKLTEAASAFANADGTIRLPNECLIVSGGA